MALETSDIQALLQRLTRASGAEELAHVTTFKGYIQSRDGGPIEITIEVRDHGPGSGSFRWAVMATDEFGNTATGNPQATLEDTIALVHWNQLGRRPE